MPPRTGDNGAVVKPCSSTNPQRRARPTASKVIDLTREASGEPPGETSGGTSPKEEEAEDAPERHRERLDKGRRYANSSAGTQERAGQGTLGGSRTQDHQPIVRRGQGDALEDSYIVTSSHHRPWVAGDDNTTVGVFSSEEEAKIAVEKDFQRIDEQVGADGWEVEWHRGARDGMLQLRGIIEEGERDSQRYTASIKRVQQKRPVVAQPRVQSAAQPKSRLAKPRYVYLVKEEQRMNVGEDGLQAFFNELGDLNAVEIHGIYLELDAAIKRNREIYDGILEDLGNEAEILIDTLDNSMAAILVENREEMMTYCLTVERRSLQ